jgi:hypothetical protein
MYKFLRITILLLILATVAQEAWLARSRVSSWREPVRVAIYPLNGDGSAVADAYLKTLKPTAFVSIEEFFTEEAQRYRLDIERPISITLAPAIAELPPQPPSHGNMLENVFWSLHMRWWAWWHGNVAGVKPQIRLFALFFNPATHATLPHSVGVQRGMIGLINVFATQTMAGSNTVVISHELLHTLGATDKYDPDSTLPRFPDGYAEPERNPRYPQSFAEIMAGRIPMTPTSAEIPDSLAQTIIGPATAAEINWLGKP